MAYGIDIGASAVKAVALTRTMKGYRVTGVGRKRVPRINRPEDARALMARTIYETLEGGESRHVGVIGLSGRDINLQVVNQPKTAPINFRTLMRYEVDQRKGGDEGLYADWCTLREPDAYFPQYLAMVGVGKSAYVDERLATATAARVDVRDAVPNAFALFALYRANYDVEGGVQMLLDVGADNMDIALVRGGRLIFARNVSSGARLFDTSIAGMANVPPDEAEARKIQFGTLGPPAGEEDPRQEEVRPCIRTAAGQLVGIIQSSIAFAKTQLQDRELTVDKVYLSGGGARLRGWMEYLTSALKIPVDLLDPFRRIDTRLVEVAEDLKQLPTDMAVAVGLGILATTPSSEGVRLSIVPDPVRKRRNFWQGPIYMVAAGVVVAVVLTLLTGVAYVRKRSHEGANEEFMTRTADLKRRVEELNRIEQEQRAAVAKEQLLLAQTYAGRGALDIVSKLRKALPEGVNIRKVEFVDLSERTRNPLPKKRCVFHAPGRGMVIGAVTKEERDGLTLTTGEEVQDLDPSALVRWEAPSRGVQIEGDIDENVRGGATAVLDGILQQLSDPSRGVVAEPFQEASREKPGWRVFRILVRFES